MSDPLKFYDLDRKIFDCIKLGRGTHSQMLRQCSHELTALHPLVDALDIRLLALRKAGRIVYSEKAWRLP